MLSRQTRSTCVVYVCIASMACPRVRLHAVAATTRALSLPRRDDITEAVRNGSKRVDGVKAP